MGVANNMLVMASVCFFAGWAQELNLGDHMHNIYQGFGGDHAGGMVAKMCQGEFYGNGNLLDACFCSRKEWAR